MVNVTFDKLFNLETLKYFLCTPLYNALPSWFVYKWHLQLQICSKSTYLIQTIELIIKTCIIRVFNFQNCFSPDIRASALTFAGDCRTWAACILSEWSSEPSGTSGRQTVTFLTSTGSVWDLWDCVMETKNISFSSRQSQDPFLFMSAPLWTLLTDTESWSGDSSLYSSVHLCGTGPGHVIHPFPVLVRVADTFVCAWAIPEMTYFDAGPAKKRF